MSIKNTDTVSYDGESNSLVIIDQTLLPAEEKLLYLTELSDIREAIYALKVRGAPAIGVAAAIGLYVVASRLKSDSDDEFFEALNESADVIKNARPTAVNLAWAVSRMQKCADAVRSGEKGPVREAVLAALKKESLLIRDEDISACRALGENGVGLIKDGYGILTHCNAGRLATVRYGTATSPMYLAHERGMNIRVYCDETRPLLQGARLTAYELSEAGIDTTLICDNMSASLMKTGKVDIVFVGADRVAANGDAANKIGTSLLALAAKHYGVPFYVVAPISSIDPDTACGDDIRIEERDPSEVTELWYEKRMAPEGIGVYNPAFDVTDNSLISGIITERGIIRAPFKDGIERVVKGELNGKSVK